MAVLQAYGIRLDFGDRVLLADVGIVIEDNARIALAGANGSGKSTLLKILAGKINANRGDVIIPKNKTVAYLNQSGLSFSDASIRDVADQAFEKHHKLTERLAKIEHELGKADSANQLRLIDEQHDIQEMLLHVGYHERQSRIEQICCGLGFSRNQLELPATSLSGGWQMRLALAQILLSAPDLMLLDEPTNYLDLETREWLLEYLKRYEGAVVLVSHDRYVLDTAVNQVAELYQAKLKIYKGSYQHYEEQRTLELEQVIAAWKRQQDEIEKLERFVDRFKAKASKATQAQSRVKMLEKIERIEIPDGIRTVHFKFPAAAPSGETVLELENVARSYGSKQVLAGLDLSIARGEKLALLGKNGAGKSTLLRLLAGTDIPTSGSIKVGHQVIRSYFAQDAEASLNQDFTILEEIESVAPVSLYPQLRTLLGSFLFQDDDVFKPISVLSGGEKSRVALVKMLLSPANVLILDEPTNHLDLNSKEILLEALKDFAGTILFVSHDRYFIRDLATRVLAIEPQSSGASKQTMYPGDFSYYLWKTGQQAENQPSNKNQEPRSVLATENSSQSARYDQKKIKNQLRKAEKDEEESLEKICFIEERINEISHKLADPAVYSNGEACKATLLEQSKAENELKEANAAWEKAHMELEKLQTLLEH